MDTDAEWQWSQAGGQRKVVKDAVDNMRNGLTSFAKQWVVQDIKDLKRAYGDDVLLDEFNKCIPDMESAAERARQTAKKMMDYFRVEAQYK